MRSNWNHRRAIAVLAAILSTGLGSVQAQQDFSKTEIKTIKLSSTLYMLMGEGGNIGVSAGTDGVYLIDDQYAPLTDKIIAALKVISGKPVKYVVNTHWHGDHTGGNENFGNRGAVIIAHDAVHARMAKGQYMAIRKITVPPAPKGALPVITFSGRAALHQNGETAKLIHVDPAHTDGDTIIHWPESNVIHTGDTFVNGMFPFIDTGSGGTLAGLIKSAETVLSLADAQTKIIPGHGPLGNKEALTRFRDMLVTARDRAMAAKAAGKTAEEWVAAKPYGDLEADWGGGFIKADMFAQMVFAAL